MISLLVAYTKNKRVIGAQGKIPWKLSSERNRFKQICAGKYVIMGRKSYEEIGKPLPYCKLVVVSSHPSTGSGTATFSLNEALDFCKKSGQEEILIAGGGTIYEQTLPYANKIYATEIDANFEGDVFFPELGAEWVGTVEEVHEEDGIGYKYITFTRK